MPNPNPDSEPKISEVKIHLTFKQIPTTPTATEGAELPKTYGYNDEPGIAGQGNRDRKPRENDTNYKRGCCFGC